MQIVELPLSKLEENPDNPRIIKDEAFEKLVESIRNFPQMLFKRPLVVETHGKKYRVLGGNRRLKACRELDMETVPTLSADDWSPEQKQEFIIKDNVSSGQWDYADLLKNWDIDLLKSWNLDVVDIPEINLNDFFAATPDGGKKRGTTKIVLEYKDSVYKKVVKALDKLPGTREEALLNLLGI